MVESLVGVMPQLSGSVWCDPHGRSCDRIRNNDLGTFEQTNDWSTQKGMMATNQAMQAKGDEKFLL